MKCDKCGCEENYVKNYEHNYLIKGKNVVFRSDRRLCKNCDSLVYDYELDNIASQKAISLYNEKYGISKEDIVSLRKSLNLSQELFSKIIGCAKKTLVSYETGKSIPNDCYFILLKSLINKPETILTLIDSNKEQFTAKEVNKINSKLIALCPRNERELLFETDSKLDIFNGFTKFSKEKIFNVIIYLAEKGILKTKLLKEMFYADFLNYKETSQSITGLEYAKLPLGPVPDQFEKILNQCQIEGYINNNNEYFKDYEYYTITPIKKFNAELFDKDELNILKRVKEKFKNFKSKEIADYSHMEKAYTETNLCSLISYEYAFDIDFE